MVIGFELFLDAQLQKKKKKTVKSNHEIVKQEMKTAISTSVEVAAFMHEFLGPTA